MGACLSSGRARDRGHLQAVNTGDKGGGEATTASTTTTSTTPPPSFAFVTIDAKGAPTPGTAASVIALAALAGIPERDVRLLLPPDPPLTTPAGNSLAGPALVARRGRAWAVGLEGCRGVALPDRVLVLACPADGAGVTGALEGGRAPEVGDAFIADLAARVRGAAAGGGGAPTTSASTTPIQAAALDAFCEAVSAGLETKAAALTLDAVGAADVLVAAIRGGGSRGGGCLPACCRTAAPAASPPPHPSSAAARLRRVKGEVSDLEAAARRVQAALAAAGGRKQHRGGAARASDGRRLGGGGGSVLGDEAASILGVAALRAGAVAGTGSRAGGAARDAEATARLALKRRALACGGM